MQLSDDIVRGELAPGIALDEAELAEHDDIVRALLRGSRTDAAAAMRAHIETVYNAYEI